MKLTDWLMKPTVCLSSLLTQYRRNKEESAKRRRQDAMSQWLRETQYVVEACQADWDHLKRSYSHMDWSWMESAYLSVGWELTYIFKGESKDGIELEEAKAKPILARLHWYWLDGFVICHWDPTPAPTQAGMVRAWLSTNLEIVRVDGGPAICTVTTFDRCLQAVLEWKALRCQSALQWMPIV